MSCKVPSDFIKVISEAQIQAKVAEIAKGIDQWLSQLPSEDGKDIVAMPIMRGAIYFFADLTRHLSHSLEIVPVRTWGYTLETIGEKAVEMKIDLAGFEAKGKTILIVDEICDSGRTLEVLCEKLRSLGAKEIKTTTLIHRKVPKLIFTPDWIGFEFEQNDWLVGYGMDDRDRFRNLPAIYKKQLK